VYVAVQRQPTLGQWWNPFSKENLIYQAGYYYAHGQPMAPSPPSSTPPPAPSDSGTSLFIPNSSITDIFMNAVTGKPTDAQIAVNTNSCIASIQKMRQLAVANGQPGPPAGEESKCVTDQQAYVKLIGGTANSQTSKTGYAWLILAGVVGGVYFVTR
jgi:hypothetical protein